MELKSGHMTLKLKMVLSIVLAAVLMRKRWQRTWALSKLPVLWVSFLRCVWGWGGGVNIYLTEDDCEDFKIRNAFTALEFSKD